MSILESEKVSICANSFVKESESLGRLHDDVVQAMQQSELPQMLKPDSNYSIKEFIEVCGILGEGCMSLVGVISSGECTTTSLGFIQKNSIRSLGQSQDADFSFT